ncbi:MAG: THUMP domain-containing protein [Acidobacteriota bacterium]
MAKPSNPSDPVELGPSEPRPGDAAEYAFIVRFSGELSLKGKRARNRFIDRLVHNLADALRSHGYRYRFERRWSRLYFTASSPDAAAVAARVFGVRAVAAVEKRRWQTPEDLVERGYEIFRQEVAGRTFAVRVRRGEHASTQNFRSPDLERALGERLLPDAAGVRLKSPEVEVRIELQGQDAYFYSRSISGESGLPMGTEGRALVLFSGGLDSPVAAWAVHRRGVRTDLLFCNLGGDQHLRDVVRVAKIIADQWSFGGGPTLIVVDMQQLAEEIHGKVPPKLRQVVLKRQMLRLGERVAAGRGIRTLVTGEAIGQVSSQTLDNLLVTSSASTIPVLRPLMAWNKEEIIDKARHLGTFDLSSQVTEFCGLEGSVAPSARVKATAVEVAERELDAALLDRSIEAKVEIDLRSFCFGDVASFEVEVASIPEGAVLLDLRPARAFSSWHPEGATSLPYPEALERFEALDRSATYAVYCELGLKSAHLVERMNRAGFKAFHLPRGLGDFRAAVERDSALLAALSPALRAPS